MGKYIHKKIFAEFPDLDFIQKIKFKQETQYLNFNSFKIIKNNFKHIKLSSFPHNLIIFKSQVFSFPSLATPTILITPWEQFKH
jgi:hypothetical protein